MSEDDDRVTISINDKSYVILCGVCNEPVAFIGERDLESGDVGCVSCGNIDKVQEVAKIAKQNARDELQLALNRYASDAARKTKFMNFEGETVNNESYRFIVDLNA